MKNLLTLSLTFIFIVIISSRTSAQSKMTIDLPVFNELELDINADVTVKQGKSQSVEVTGPQDLIDLLNKEIKGETWTIKYTKRKVKTKNSLKIMITVSELEEVDVNGSGDIRGENAFHTNEMEIGVNGSGSIDLEIYVEELEIGINGSGNVILNGSAEKLSVGINGSGDVKCEELVVESGEFEINGSGNTKIHVTKKLSASINGSGDIHYSGDPDIKLRKNGSGSIKKIEN